MPITGVSHIGLCVSNLDGALRFYCDLLGFRVLQRISGVRSLEVARLLEVDALEMSLTFIERENVRIELITFDKPLPAGGGKRPFNRLGYTHLSVKVSGFDAELERFRAANVEVLESTIGGESASNARFAFVLDPDGNRVELFGMIDETGHKPWDIAEAAGPSRS
jgi:lactoylglutathione lyase